MSGATDSNRPVVIVGAGVTGLTAAAELERRGIGCVLLEASDAVGGMSRSRVMDGVIFDTGPHMLMMNPHRKCGLYSRRLLSGEQLLRRRYLFSVCNGRRCWQSPMSPAEYLRYPIWAKRSVLLASLGRLASKDGAETLADYISRRSGIGLYQRVFAPLVIKKLGIRGSELHRNWWTRPLKPVKAWRKGEGLEPDTANPLAAAGKVLHDMLPYYLYPAGGIGRIPKLLHDRFTGETVTGCGSISLNWRGTRITGVASHRGSFPASAVIWTAPPGDLYEALGEDCPAPSPTSSTRIVYATFKVERPRRRPYLYTYHHGENTVFNRVYYPASIFRDRSPHGIEGLCFETRLDGKIRSLPGERLIEGTASDAMRTGIIRGTLLSADIEDVEDASPLFSTDYLERESALFSAAERFHNLVFAGRQGNYCNCTLTGAVEQGILAAETTAGSHEEDSLAARNER